MKASSKSVGADPRSAGGEWLFRQGELILGPVPADQIVEKLYGGELDGRTEVSRPGQGQFRRLSEIDYFRVHLAKADAKRRVDAQAAEQAVKNRRRRNVRLAILGVVAMLVAAAAAVGARYLAVHKPWKDTDELAFADLISVEAPVIGRAKATKPDEELVDYPGSKRPLVAERSAAPPKLASRQPVGKPGGGETSEEPDGMQVAKFDKDAINSVVAARQRSLYPCLVAEASKQPGLKAKIPIEFVIGNDGRVTQVWVDHPQFKTGSLPECLLRELQKWPFKPYPGERATVGLSFKIGKDG